MLRIFNGHKDRSTFSRIVIRNIVDSLCRVAFTTIIRFSSNNFQCYLKRLQRLILWIVFNKKQYISIGDFVRFFISLRISKCVYLNIAYVYIVVIYEYVGFIISMWFHHFFIRYLTIYLCDVQPFTYAILMLCLHFFCVVFCVFSILFYIINRHNASYSDVTFL